MTSAAPPLPPAPLVVERTGSTSDWARDHRARLADGQFVVALEQTAGRGRHGRGWSFVAGNLAASARCVLHPAERPVTLFALAAGVALHRVAASHAAGLWLKWPNDLMAGATDRPAKLGGLLVEREADELVVGCGVNLTAAPDVPGRPVASLAALGAAPPPPAGFAAALGDELARVRAMWRQRGAPALRAAWLERAHPPGTPLVALAGAERVPGRFLDLTAEGGLVLELPDGARRTLASADVWPAV